MRPIDRAMLERVVTHIDRARRELRYVREVWESPYRNLSPEEREQAYAQMEPFIEGFMGELPAFRMLEENLLRDLWIAQGILRYKAAECAQMGCKKPAIRDGAFCRWHEADAVREMRENTPAVAALHDMDERDDAIIAAAHGVPPLE